MSQYDNLLKNLPDFISAVLREFWQQNPSDYARFKSLLGQRIFEVNQGLLRETEYLEKWKTDANSQSKV